MSPLFKKGKQNNLDNYRPISILPAISKVFERLMYDQLYGYLSSNNILSDYQFGFRKNYSTTSALIEATNSWFVDTDRGLLNIVVILDFKKAFDTVNHSILLDKLQAIGIHGASHRLLHSYLTNRTQRCLANGFLSDDCRVTCGVPQGSILGPLLFLIFINDLPNCLIHSTPRHFADDTHISVSGKNLDVIELLVNTELNSLSTWLVANKLSLNVAKTEFMLVGSRPRIAGLPRDPILKIGDIQIKRVSYSEILGVVVDEDLSWHEHIEKIFF